MPNETKQEQENVPNVKQDGWNIREIVEESVNKSSDEMVRETLRGDESEGDANDRDVVGGVNSNETPQGREEAKKSEKRGEIENG